MNKVFLGILVSGGLLLGGCAFMSSSGTSPTEDNPGFLENYNILKQIPSESGTKSWRYINPQFANHEYTSVIVQKVNIYQKPDQGGVSEATIKNTKQFISNFTTQHLQEHQYTVVKNSGPKVAAIEMVVSGAEVEPQTWKLRKIIPVSDALAMAKGEMAKDAGDDSALVFEIGSKAIDTQSGLLVGASFVSVPAEMFVGKAGNETDFQNALKPWISLSLDHFTESH